MYFEEKGEGFPLVLLHGNGEDHHAFQEICIHSWKNKKFPGAICSVFLTEEILPFTSPCSFLPP